MQVYIDSRSYNSSTTFLLELLLTASATGAENSFTDASFLSTLACSEGKMKAHYFQQSQY